MPSQKLAGLIRMTGSSGSTLVGRDLNLATGAFISDNTAFASSTEVRIEQHLFGALVVVDMNERSLTRVIKRVKRYTYKPASRFAAGQCGRKRAASGFTRTLSSLHGPRRLEAETATGDATSGCQPNGLLI